jgi:hypothetical protein
MIATKEPTFYERQIAPYIHIPVDDAIEIIHDLATKRLRAEKFTKLGERRWVRVTKEPIREVFEITTYSSHFIAHIAIGAGLALPFVPCVNYRTGKPTQVGRPELREHPLSLYVTAKDKLPPFEMLAQPSRKVLIAKLKTSVPAWLDIYLRKLARLKSLSDVRDVLAQTRKQMPERNPEHRMMPTQYVALAFTHAKLGEWRKAKAVLESVIRHDQEVRNYADKLRALLIGAKPS